MSVDEILFKWSIVISPLLCGGCRSCHWLVFRGVGGRFFTAITILLLSTVVVFHGRPIPGIMECTPVVSSFFEKFQIVDLALPIGSSVKWLWLIFPLFTDSEWFAFLPQMTLWFSCWFNKTSSQVKTKPKTDILNYLLFEQSLSLGTPGHTRNS